jgi:serine/threonine protein kinase
LKLENILLDHQMQVKVIDFGFTREYESTRNKMLETFCGSTAYAAPGDLNLPSAWFKQRNDQRRKV